MAKNQNTNKNSETTLCEKLKRAFNISPFQKTHRTSHQHSQSINNNNASANNPPLQSQLIPIESGGQEEKYDNAKPHGSASSMNRKVVKISSTGHKPMPEMAKHGGNTMPKAEPGKPFTAVQEWQLKPFDGASKEKTTHDHGDATVHGNDKFSAYITGVRNRMRTSSDLGIQRTATMVTKRDSFNDKVTGFLNRAKLNRRTTSNVGDK